MDGTKRFINKMHEFTNMLKGFEVGSSSRTKDQIVVGYEGKVYLLTVEEFKKEDFPKWHDLNSCVEMMD